MSGGCFNPVVALAVAFRNFGTDLAPIFKPSTLLLYIAAQVAGALAAGGTAAAILVGDHKVGHPSVGSGSDMGSAFLGEMVGTCLVVLVVLGTATVESTRDNMYFALAIGFAILGAGAAVGGASGGCFNPAVGLLVFVSDSNLADAWIYWVAPPIGALFGLMAFRFVYYDDVAAEELGVVSKPDRLWAQGSALAPRWVNKVCRRAAGRITVMFVRGYSAPDGASVPAPRPFPPVESQLSHLQMGFPYFHHAPCIRAKKGAFCRGYAHTGVAGTTRRIELHISLFE